MSFMLHVSIQAYYGTSWQITAQGDTLSWIKTFNGNVIRERNITLAPKVVESFLMECEELGVFTWEPHYLDCCMLDGASWSVEIRQENSAFRSAGTNGYPGKWAEFCSSLMKLSELDDNPCKTMVSPVDKFRKP